MSSESEKDGGGGGRRGEGDMSVGLTCVSMVMPDGVYAGSDPHGRITKGNVITVTP